MLLSYLKEHYGDLASVVGLLVSLIGFIVTIINVRKTKRAAEDARQATREAVERIGSQLLGSDISASLQLIRELDATCRKRNWEAAIDRCDEARTRLAHLSENRRLKSAERDYINSKIDEFRDLMAEIQKLQEAPMPRGIPPKTSRRLHEIITDLSRISGRIQSEIMEI